MRKTLSVLTGVDLAATRTAPTDGRTITVAWGLLYALAHMGVHGGHMQLVRQLWEQTITKPNKEHSA